MNAKQASRWIIRITRNQMRARRMKKSELARRMNVSPAYISKMLKGKENFSFKTMEKLANALNMNFQVHLNL